MPKNKPLRASKTALQATETVIREEWPVTLAPPGTEAPRRPFKMHPIFGHGWSVSCPHCGGQTKIWPTGNLYELQAHCWNCGATGTPVLPVREDWYG